MRKKKKFMNDNDNNRVYPNEKILKLHKKKKYLLNKAVYDVKTKANKKNNSRKYKNISEVDLLLLSSLEDEFSSASYSSSVRLDITNFRLFSKHTRHSRVSKKMF